MLKVKEEYKDIKNKSKVLSIRMSYIDAEGNEYWSDEKSLRKYDFYYDTEMKKLLSFEEYDR